MVVALLPQASLPPPTNSLPSVVKVVATEEAAAGVEVEMEASAPAATAVRKEGGDAPASAFKSGAAAVSGAVENWLTLPHALFKNAMTFP